MSSIEREIVGIKRRLDNVEMQSAKQPSRMQNSAGGGGGSQNPMWYVVPKEDDLPDSTLQTALGRTTYNPPGGVYVRNSENTGWECITHWR